MGSASKSFRQSVSLPARLAKRVKSLAKAQRTSANRVMVDLIESGIEAKEREKQRFYALTSRLTDSRDPAERDKLKKELARMTFGE
jgi:prephenate dehydratase